MLVFPISSLTSRPLPLSFVQDTGEVLEQNMLPAPRRPQGPPRTILLLTLLFLGCAFALLLQAVSAFVLPNHHHHRQHHRPHHYHVQPTSTRLALSPAFSLGLSADQVEEKLEKVWATDVPSSLDAIINEAQASLSVALAAGEKRLRVDVRTPGMDEQFEQTAIREKVKSSTRIYSLLCAAWFLMHGSLPSSLFPFAPLLRPSSSVSSKPSFPSSPRNPQK